MTGVARVSLCWRMLVLFGTFLARMEEAKCSQEVIHNMSKDFAVVLEECKKQENVGDHIMQDFHNFWHEEYALVNNEMGCIMICMAGKLDLVDGDDNMHHEKAHEFAKKHGADDALAKQLVAMVRECEQISQAVEERCARALETTKCFRGKIHGLKWAPSMKIIMEEVMAAM